MLESTAEIRPRYVETDQMGVVHHSAYLAWMEVARTEYLRERGVPYRDLEARGIRMPVLALEVRYRKPARYDEVVVVRAHLEEASPIRFAFNYAILRKGDGETLCTGRTEHVATDLDGRPRRIPADLLVTLRGGHL